MVFVVIAVVVGFDFVGFDFVVGVGFGIIVVLDVGFGAGDVDGVVVGAGFGKSADEDCVIFGDVIFVVVDCELTEVCKI